MVVGGGVGARGQQKQAEKNLVASQEALNLSSIAWRCNS